MQKNSTRSHHSTGTRAVAGLLGALMTTGLLTAAAAPAPAQAAKPERFTYELGAVPHNPQRDGGSEASGRVTITLKGDRATVRLKARGMSPGLPHAQHIHGVGENECPGPDRRDDRVDDGLIDTAEGLPDYGAVQVSLTTAGDTSAGSTLALDRFPVADEQGKLSYKRTFTIGADPAEGGFPKEIAKNLRRHHVVLHGIDQDHNRQYDFHLGSSGLGQDVPLEGELPAACGTERHGH